METSPIVEELLSQDTHLCFSNPKVELGKEIYKSDFINRINYANFENIALTVLFKHKIFGRLLFLKAIPKPYIDKNLDLTWINSISENENLSQFQCEKILIPSFGKYLAFITEDYLLTSDGMTLTLPDRAYELSNRKKIREFATMIEATIIQNGTLFKGKLKNFHSDGFLISFRKENSSNFKLLNNEESISLLLNNEETMLFSGICRISAFRESNGLKECVAVPNSNSFKRFKSKDYRGERYRLKSPLQVSFSHPLSNKNKQLRIKDLSGSGFSLLESSDKAVLFAGLIIPEIRILLPGSNFLSCKVQVVYSRREKDDDSKEVTCGLVILDMDPQEYSKLLDFIHHDLDDRANICNDVDMDALWSFFFESGFIYPAKYKYILNNKEKIKSLYKKLYTEQPGIARHFIYQEENHIKGHMSMLRSYENTWLLHHHAASTMGSRNSGLHVLNQVGSFTNNCHRIKSMHMNYLMCYFRRDNKFPNRIFGGSVEKIEDNKKCSLDDWGYYHFNKENIVLKEELKPYSISKTTEGELKDLECLYEYSSGGLMLKAFNLEDGYCDNKILLEDYKVSGFTREILLYSVKRDYDTCAIVMIDHSEAGLNMSDLTNSFKIFIINPKVLNPKILNNVLQELSCHYPEAEKIPVLIYPNDQAKEMDLPIEKVYTMWVINMEATDSYFHYLKKLLRNIRH